MLHFCTSHDASSLDRGRALYDSLQVHAGTAFELTALCLDETVAQTLAAQKLPGVKVLALSDLLAKAPILAAARADRTAQEFYLTCRSWLMRHLLAQIPAGEILTYLDANLYFFSSLAPIFDELGAGSIAITPFRYPPELAARERYGKFNSGLICLRHDDTGLACVADWARRCAAWCFTTLENDRYADQKYLDAWSSCFPGTVSLMHPGINVAPWNIASRVITTSAQGLRIDDQPLICYQFHGLTHLAEQLYDPGLQQYGVEPTAALRELVYYPYLRKIGRIDSVPSGAPDIVPPGRVDDPRCGPVLAQLLEQQRATQRDRAALERILAVNRAETRQFFQDSQAREISTARYVSDIEEDRAAQRRELLDVKGKLLKAYDDLLRDVDTIKDLKTEIASLRTDKDAQIASLAAELNQRSTATALVEAKDVRGVLEPYGRKVRRLMVLKYHDRLLPEILWLASMGTQVEVLSSPPEFTNGPQGPVIFRPQSAWEWLGQIDSLFNEKAYLAANPDVAGAVAKGAVASGWDHYLRFGQREFRNPGSTSYCTGLAEFDAVAFDGTDAAALVPLLAGRLQPQNRLFISGFIPPADWLPSGEDRTYILGTTLVCERPPKDWLGPRWPANGLACHLPEVRPEQLYPDAPEQRAVWPKLTVITVSCNQAADLEETIRSVLDQNYPRIEYIIIDGGSTDGSLEIIRKYASRVVLLERAKGRNSISLLNEGLKKSTGGMVTWLNVGDRLAPGSLFTVGQICLLHKIDMVAGRCARVRKGEVIPWQIHRTCLPLDRIAPLSLRDLLDLDGAWLKDCFFNQPEVFFSREIFDRAGGRVREDLQAGLEYDLWVRLAKAGAQAFAIPEILALRRQHQATTADVIDPATLTELRAVNAAHLKVSEHSATST